MTLLRGWNRTGRDADEEDAVAAGMVEATPEEALARDWETADAAVKGGEPVLAPAWTAFSPAECKTIAAALEVCSVASAVAGAVFTESDRAVLAELRAKAAAGAAR